MELGGARVDLSDGARFLAPDFGVRSACGWTEWRFGRPLTAAESHAEAVNLEPIRNLGAKVGRNDPCPCGSGKKFKNCCAKSSGVTAG